MTNTVRETRRADELKRGDWLAPGELADWAAEVLLAEPYTDEVENDKVLLVYRVLNESKPSTERAYAAMPFELATDEEIAEHRKAAERAKQIGDVRALADWLEANPWLPIADLDVNRHLYGEDGYRTVVELAGRLGAKLDTHLDDRTKFVFTKGPLTYTLLAWHEKGRPAEPAPETVTHVVLHRADHTACGVPVAGLGSDNFVTSWSAISTCKACGDEAPF